MKVVVIGMHGADGRLLFEDERLEHVRRLMEVGTYGPLAGADPLRLRTALADRFEEGRLVFREVRQPGLDGADATAPLDAHLQAAGFLFVKAREAVAEGGWSCLYLEDVGIDRLQRGHWKYFDERAGGDPASELGRAVPEFYAAVDAGLGSLLEVIDAETAVACVSAYGPAAGGLFVLAGPGCPAGGPVPSATAGALVRALLEAAGLPVPAELTEESLGVAAADDASEIDDEEAIRDRLSGLGYI